MSHRRRGPVARRIRHPSHRRKTGWAHGTPYLHGTRLRHSHTARLHIEQGEEGGSRRETIGNVSWLETGQGRAGCPATTRCACLLRQIWA
eukprot:365772-Chlamydomonas_euryale.AAC.1